MLAVVAWVVGALTAVAVGLFALSSVGTGLFGQPADPLAQAGDPEPPAVATVTTPAVTTPAATPTESTAATDQPLDSPGGTVVARCVQGGAYLAFWSPAQGFHADDVIRGPAAVVRVTFESPTRELRMTIRCVDGVAESTVGPG